MLKTQQDKLFFEFSQLKQDPLPEGIRPYGERIGVLVQWLHQYLCKPHPELGRTGPVCPFVPTALENRTLFVSFFPEVTGETTHDQWERLVLAERDQFLAMEPRRGNEAQFKAFLLLFPNLPDPMSHDQIDSVQARLQEQFVNRGLMVGEFHSGPPDKRGLWNEGFRPLACPVPLLAIRHMVPTDILFLKGRSTLVAQYLRYFGDAVPGKFKHLVEEAAHKFGFDLPDKKAKTSSAPTVIYHLQKNNIPYMVYRHSVFNKPIKRPEDFAEVLGCDVARISKALFVRDPKRTRFAILVCGATRKVDMQAVARRMGVKRLVMADLSELQQRVGHPPLAVTPIGVEGIPVFMDADLFRFPTILTGAGVPKMEMSLSPKDLQSLSQAEVFAFAT